MKLILVIEDDLPVRTNLVELLEAEGYHTQCAENGLSGLAMAQEHHPDLIISDVMMPELDGFGVLARLRQSAATSTIPFIFLTARAEKADLRQGMNLGADDYLTKPFTRAELLDAINTRLVKQEALTQRYVSEIKQVEEKLHSLTLYDFLTGLPNRLMLRQQFAQQLTATGPLLEGWFIPVISLGIDRFNRVNERLGYSHGDALLRAVAQRLLQSGGPEITLARLQAAQFALILPATNRVEEVNTRAQDILFDMFQPFHVGPTELFISTSLGVACYPQDGTDLDLLLKKADAAQSYARERGGNNFEAYRTEMEIGSHEQLSIETSLRYALERGELQIYYQPQVDLREGRVVGAEALLRWQHPERGMVSPAEFIPLAEETNLIIPIGEWVLRTACAQAKAWQEAGLPPIRVAVNLSVRQFMQPRLSHKIVQILEETGLEPQFLEVELTESILMQNVETALTTLAELKRLGVQVAIDDFGTGYSSLSQLKRLPFDTLKIDQSFVRNVTNNAENTAITIAIIQMAHNLRLNLKVIAEGVETPSELSFLREYKCDEMQGYLFSRPLPVKAFHELLVSGRQLDLVE